MSLSRKIVAAVEAVSEPARRIVAALDRLRRGGHAPPGPLALTARGPIGLAFASTRVRGGRSDLAEPLSTAELRGWGDRLAARV